MQHEMGSHHWSHCQRQCCAQGEPLPETVMHEMEGCCKGNYREQGCRHKEQLQETVSQTGKAIT
eukprot:1158067-Pelagomonas_calceolata.AAC.10